MRRTYYTANAHLGPSWLLPDADSFKIEGDILTGRTSSKIANFSEHIEPPHTVFANLGYDPKHPHSYASDDEVIKFIKRYGTPQTRRANTPGTPFKVSLENVRTCQMELRHAWNAGDARYFTEPQDAVTWMVLDELRADWRATPRGLELRPVSLIAYMGILLARDLAEGFARRCQNPECPAPYFVVRRRDAKFCSRKCANDVTVKRFRVRRKEDRAKRRKSRRKR